MNIGKSEQKYNLTLTRVVFESFLVKYNNMSANHLTLTRVVFELLKLCTICF